VGELNPITRFYFATEIRGLERLLLGNKGEPRWVGGKGQVLTGSEVHW